MTDIRRAVEAVWRLESAAIVAGLTAMVRDIGLAEELAGDALVAALEQWPVTGLPDSPGAWLMTVAKRRAVDRLRRDRRLVREGDRLAREAESPRPAPDRTPAQDGNDVLRLMFLTCHPVLSTGERVALTLRLLGGLTAAEIARAFLTDEARIVRRVAGAKRRLAAERASFDLPPETEFPARLASVFDVVYLIFNEGYAATSGDDLLRSELCLEALRLGRLLAARAPEHAEVHGLVALMELQASRSAARIGPAGEPIPLEEQHRGRWDPLLIRRGFTALLRARDLGVPPGPYVLQAAVAACHARARSAADTDWPAISALYDALVGLLPTPVVRLNRAVARGRAHGPVVGLEAIDELSREPALRDYHLLPAARGDLLTRLGRTEEARWEFARAAALTGNAAERAFLLRRAEALAGDGDANGVGAPAPPTLGTAVTAFLEALVTADRPAATRRGYGTTLRRLCLALGGERPMNSVAAEDVAGVFETLWGHSCAGTWNRHRAAVRALAVHAEVEHLIDGVPRRSGPRERRKPIDPETLRTLWELPGVALRERTLWRLVHESGVGPGTVLSLNVEDLDREDRRAVVNGTEVLWRSATARLLARLVAGRTRGPVFLTDRRPAPARAGPAGDLCPETGRARLSYERAEYLFKRATCRLDPRGEGFTLGRLARSPRVGGR
ncbi:RNA polymerase subunit sigma [Streptomyces alkaliphilus]|uniref:RNA polymerase subunit sigma n=1 Tax=Streptomyces alkaliphilus TaxID=1472722 RepID=A0A7W3TF42_9ACTN|nr:DUF6596 domain-containing protein [Streptomyces alkaliphilus]MBB0245582.1 RNA polymerase subunit sigma [Streptomyces alkaliphilus]